MPQTKQEKAEIESYRQLFKDNLQYQFWNPTWDASFLKPEDVLAKIIAMKEDLLQLPAVELSIGESRLLAFLDKEFGE